MSKSSVIENKVFHKSAPVGGGFNLVPQVNSFNSVFDTKPLDSSESAKLKKLLVDGFQPGTIQEEQVESDITTLKQITSEIRAIGKQCIILLGERVCCAREMLKPYKDGTFTRWLESAFGTRKTGYNALSYYELYTALPREDLRDRFKQLQHRTAYILASRDGDIETKAEIISEHHDKTHEELVMLIKEKLPVAEGDRRVGKLSIRRLLSTIRIGIEKIHGNKDSLTLGEKIIITQLKESLESLVSDV